MIDRANAADLIRVVLLEQEGFPPVERWSGESWGQELGHADHLVLVHRPDADSPAAGSRPSAVWGTDSDIDAVAAFSATDDFGDLLRVIVTPAARRRGIATALVAQGIDWIAAQGATRVFLEVSQRNQAAIKLYQKLGFEQFSERRDYYGPGLDAWVMLRSIAPANGDPADSEATHE